jgi:hypothetical protein
MSGSRISSPIEPIDSIRQSLLIDLNSTKDLKERDAHHASLREGDTLVALLKAAAGYDPRPIILLFDQFEQFFVNHDKRPREREEFVRKMREWLQEADHLPASVLVCLRADFYDRMIKFQKAIGLTLGPQDIFQLDEFDANEATEVFRVVAESEGLRFEERFVRDTLAPALANQENGLISPVDVQILLWIIAGQKGHEKALNLATYQKLGGVEGLLERFLKRALDSLDPRENGSLRKAAIKVMLALTDLERNARASMLSLDGIIDKLEGAVSTSDAEEALRWLERNDIRLVTKYERNEGYVYELAHERLIPALRRRVGQEFREADKANVLLSRRVNEWIDNGFSSRYLLTYRELGLIKKHIAFIEWGKQKEQKGRLMAKSERRLRFRIVSASLIALVPLVLYGLSESSWAQIWQAKKELYEHSKRVEDGKVLLYSAVAYIALEDFEKAREVEDKIKNVDIGQYLTTIVDAYVKVGNYKGALQFIERYRAYAESFSKSKYGQGGIFQSVAAAYANAGDLDAVIDCLNSAQVLAESAQEQDRNQFILNIVIAYTQIAIKTNHVPFIDLASELAEKLKGSFRVSALYNIVNALKSVPTKTNARHTMNRAWSMARTLEDVAPQMRSQALFLLFYTFKESGELETSLHILGENLRIARAIRKDEEKIDALLSIANGYAMTGNRESSAELIREAERLTESIKGTAKADALLSIAEALASSGDLEKAVEVVNQTLQYAQTLSDTERTVGPDGITDGAGKTDRSYVIINTGSLYGTIAEETNNLSWLSQAQELAASLGAEDRDEALNDIVDTYVSIAEETKKPHLLHMARNSAGGLSGSRRPEALLQIAESFAQMGETNASNNVLAEIGSIKDWNESTAVRVVSLCLRDAVELKSREFIRLGRGLFDFLPDGNKPRTLIDIAMTYAKIGDANACIEGLKEAELFNKRHLASYKDSALLMGKVVALANHGNWKEARETANLIGPDILRAKALSLVLLFWAAKKHPWTLEVLPVFDVNS